MTTFGGATPSPPSAAVIVPTAFIGTPRNRRNRDADMAHFER